MNANGEVVTLAPLEITFNNSRVIIEDIHMAEGAPGKKLVLFHPCGIAAVALLPEEAAKNIGAQLLGSGKIELATRIPEPPR